MGHDQAQYSKWQTQQSRPESTGPGGPVRAKPSASAWRIHTRTREIHLNQLTVHPIQTTANSIKTILLVNWFPPPGARWRARASCPPGGRSGTTGTTPATTSTQRPRRLCRWQAPRRRTHPQLGPKRPASSGLQGGWARSVGPPRGRAPPEAVPSAAPAGKGAATSELPSTEGPRPKRPETKRPERPKLAHPRPERPEATDPRPERPEATRPRPERPVATQLRPEAGRRAAAGAAAAGKPALGWRRHAWPAGRRPTTAHRCPAWWARTRGRASEG